MYFETSSNSPYHIRRIEELNKVFIFNRPSPREENIDYFIIFPQTPNGNVEAKVMCFFRRRDLPSSLVMLADKHQQGNPRIIFVYL